MCECECVSVVYLGCLSWLQLQEFIVSGSLVVGMSRRPQYVHSICAYGEDQYHMWRPIPPPQVAVRVWYDIAVIYLPSTAEAGSAQPLDSSTFAGSEIVFSPIVSKIGKYPWKNDVPKWIEPWMQCLMEIYSVGSWNLIGFSRFG